VIPLADLHRHLDGSLRESTLRELAAAKGVQLLPSLRFRPAMGLGAALSFFEMTLAVLQDRAALRRVAAECCEDAVTQGVTTLELRFAPQLHGELSSAVDAVADGVGGRAGIILCALYGDPPSLVEELVRVGAANAAVVGIDLAAGPSGAHRWQLRDYAAPFQLAARLGLGRTVHAGEGRPPEEIRIAIEELGAQRIGHGTSLLDDPRVVEVAWRREVTIEACLSSNLHTGVISSIAEHPLRRWLDAGVKACVCTDNTLFSDTNPENELQLARTLPAMTEEHIAALIAEGHRAAFRST
jgi:adenosine deaminase